MYHVQGTVAAKVRGELTAIYRSAAPVAFGVLVFLSLAQAFDCFGQLCAPRILSQLELPETYNAAASHHLTADGGFIFGGTAYGGQSSPSYGAGDFFIVRFDPNLQEVWEQSFGGANGDTLASARQTSDGGFILVGESWSVPSGTKTSPNYGWSDFWVVRTDSAGTLLWEQSFGGSGFDSPWDVQQTADGGFIVGGYSGSLADGNKTSPNYGGFDYWVVRIDSSGNKLWEHSFGGSGSDRLVSLLQTSDGGFIVGGISDSPNDGTKTEPYYGGLDYWVIRLDGAGNELWERAFGGDSYDELIEVHEAADGSFILVGSSYSWPSGNKTAPLRSNQDYWIVAVDANGNELWQQSVGGGDGTYAVPRDAVQMLDGGWVIGGSFSTSFGPTPGGNKTSRNFGQTDYWLVRLNSAGNILWDQGYGARYYEYLYALEKGSDGGLLLIGQSDSVPGGNKTTALLTSSDVWLLKLGLETPGDCDGDGVPDAYDACPGTTSGVVNGSGCSMAQLCPCDGPWTNHSDYVACVTRVSGDFFQAGLITETERSNTVVQAMAANCPFVPTPVLAFGLTNIPIHDALIGFDHDLGNGLIAANLGFDGMDGVSVHLGEADSGVFIYPDAPVYSSYNEAWYMRARAYGSVNGQTNSLLSIMQATKPNYETYPVDVDFSTMGADSVTYQVFANTSLVAQATENGPVAHLIINSASYLSPRANPLWREADGRIGARIDLEPGDNPYRFSITGPFYDVAGNHIFIWANNPTNAVDFVSNVDIVEGGGLERFTVVNARLGMFHRAHQALDAAIFTAAGGKLTVTTATNSNGDCADCSIFAGTLIEANDVSRFDVQVEPIRLETNGAIFEAYLSTSIAEQPDIFASVGITNEGGVLRLNSAFSLFYLNDTNLNPTFIVLKIYNNGSLVGDTTNSANPITISAGYSVPAIVNCGAGGSSNSIRYLAFTLDQQATFNDGNGTVLQGNQFRLVFVDTETRPASVSQLTLGVRNLESFTILSEHSDSAPPALNIALSDASLMLSWPNDNRPFVLEATTSLDQPFTPVNAAVVFSENRNKITLPLQPTSNQFFRLHSSAD